MLKSRDWKKYYHLQLKLVIFRALKKVLFSLQKSIIFSLLRTFHSLEHLFTFPSFLDALLV